MYLNETFFSPWCLWRTSVWPVKCTFSGSQPVRIGGRINTQFLFEQLIGERLNAHSNFCVFWREPCQHATHAVPAWRLTCIHAIVSRSPWVHGSVAPDKRHCQQWMSLLFCGYLPYKSLYPRPVPLTYNLLLLMYQPRICKDGFISIVFDLSPVCCLFDRVQVDNRPLRRSLPTV